MVLASVCPSAALSDADAALRSDSNNSLALYRRATALFYLDDFTAALSAFRQAEALGSKQSALFIRKCEAELLRRNQSRTAAAAPKATDTAQPAIAAAHAAPIGTGGEARSGGNGNGSSGVSTAGVSQSAGVSLSSRVTESWFQSRETVTVTLFAKKLAKDAVRASVDPSTPHLLSARVELPDGSVLNKQWSLFGAVQPDDVAVHVTAYKVELLLHKQSEEEWLGLLDTDRRAVEGVVKRDNVVREEAPVSSYPTSSRKKVEWSEVESAASKQEEDDKPQGDAALQKLFQTIYKDANEDTRRAMVKSFQTSGGTVLSTNWKEVKETDYVTIHTHTHTHTMNHVVRCVLPLLLTAPLVSICCPCVLVSCRTVLRRATERHLRGWSSR